MTAPKTPAGTFAEMVAQRHDDHLLDHGPAEQTHTVLKRLLGFATTTPLVPVTDKIVNLAGFGEVPVHFESKDEEYMLLSDIADQLGWPLYKAHAMAEREYGFAVAEQRRIDEERGDGRLGYECMRDWVDLGLSLVMEDPEAKPDAGGGRWSFASDWLVSHDRLPLVISKSPWGREFMDNTLPAFGHAMRAIWGDKLKSIPTYDVDGTPTPGSAADLFSTDGLTEEEARRRAVRGPALPDGDADE